MAIIKQLPLSGPPEMYVSYGQFLAYDKSESQPGSLWTDRHVAQGFVRRDYALGIGTLLEHGNSTVRVFLGPPPSLKRYERAVGVPVKVASGVLCVEGPEEYPIERSVQLHPGLYYLIAAQLTVSEDQLELDLFLHSLSEPACSRILKADRSLRPQGDLLETGEVAR